MLYQADDYTQIASILTPLRNSYTQADQALTTWKQSRLDHLKTALVEAHADRDFRFYKLDDHLAYQLAYILPMDPAGLLPIARLVGCPIQQGTLDTLVVSCMRSSESEEDLLSQLDRLKQLDVRLIPNHSTLRLFMGKLLEIAQILC